MLRLDGGAGCEGDRADELGAVVQRRRTYVDHVAVGRDGAAHDGVADRVEERGSGGDEGAADDDDRGVEDVAHDGEPAADGAADVGDGPQRSEERRVGKEWRSGWPR